jgi:hypothetical protein
VALELELTDKGVRRREAILAAYGSEARIEAVVYLVTSKRLGRSTAASAARLGIAPRVQVQLVGSPIEEAKDASGLVRVAARGSRVTIARPPGRSPQETPAR